MADLLTIFESITVLAFAIVLLLAGIFTMYFGAGKSRAIGGILFIVSIIAFISFYYLWGTSSILETIIWPSIVAILATLVGGLIAVGIFLVAIMKS
jgi:hypothetical protein